MKNLFLSTLMTGAIMTSGYAQNYKSKTIQNDDLTREYSIYIPSSYDGNTSFPLLFNFHGGDDVISNWQTSADMRPIADTANFILVYPQARPDPSDGNSLNWLPKTPGTFDDVPFISALIDTIVNDYQIDQNRIYACGYSLGGDMSFELGCKLSNRISAIAPVARTMQANPNSFCAPSHPMGVLTILGTSDFISPYEGFPGWYLSATETHSYWASHNNCDQTAAMSTVSPSVERYTWSTAKGCAYVEELKVIGGGHDWPGSFGNMTINANEEIWQFLSRYDINGLIGCTTTSPESTAVVQTSVRNALGNNMSNSNVKINNDNPELEVQGMGNGSYEITGPPGENLAVEICVEPEPFDVSSKISALDLLGIQRHILGLTPLCENGSLAADVNENGSVSGIDLLQISRVLLGLDDQFAKGMPFYKIYTNNVEQSCVTFSFHELIDQTIEVNFLLLEKGNITDSCP